jgi:hypothetical protein
MYKLTALEGPYPDGSFVVWLLVEGKGGYWKYFGGQFISKDGAKERITRYLKGEK